MAASSDAVPVSERSDLCSDSSNKRSGMWVAAYGYSKEEKSPGELIALRRAFEVPVIFANVFILLAVYPS